MPKKVQEQLEKQYEIINKINEFNSNWTNTESIWSYYPKNFNDSEVKYEILTGDSKKILLEKLYKFKESNKILDISFSTNTKYSKIFDKEYTEYSVFIEYI